MLYVSSSVSAQKRVAERSGQARPQRPNIARLVIPTVYPRSMPCRHDPSIVHHRHWDCAGCVVIFVIIDHSVDSIWER